MIEAWIDASIQMYLKMAFMRAPSPALAFQTPSCRPKAVVRVTIRHYHIRQPMD